MKTWKTEWGNDPDRDFALVIEVQEGENWRGRLERLESGELVFFVYPSADGFRVPAKWLADLLRSAELDFPKVTSE